MCNKMLKPGLSVFFFKNLAMCEWEVNLHFYVKKSHSWFSCWSCECAANCDNRHVAYTGLDLAELSNRA